MLIIVFHLTDHIIGKSDNGEQGFKTHDIERKTGCAVTISRGELFCLTIRPVPTCRGQFDLSWARELVEDSLLEFVGCDGAQARLLYELALHLQGRPLSRHVDGAVRQRRTGASRELFWMKLLDLPDALARKEDLQSFDEEVRRWAQTNAAGCAVEVFAHGLGNLTVPARFCRPFVLVSVPGDGQIETARSMGMLNDALKQVSVAINEYRRRCTRNEAEAHARMDTTRNDQSPSKPHQVSLGKRRPPSDESSLSSRSHNHAGPSSEHPRKKQNNGEVRLILTVPLWVMQKCTMDKDLFGKLLPLVLCLCLAQRMYQLNLQLDDTISVHLVGDHGRKHKELVAQTNALITVSNFNSRERRPMTITIKSRIGASTPADDVRKAKVMIEGSLMEFVDDKNSEGRLVYELAMMAEGSFEFRREGGAVQQLCHTPPHDLVWMKLLELPSIDHGRHLFRPDSKQWIRGGTRCVVKVHCAGFSLPRLSDPYVLVFGRNLDEVDEVSGRVAAKLDEF